MPYRQLTLRPVLLRGKMMMQLSVFTERQDITKNYTPQQAQQELSRLLQLPWSNAALVTLQESVTVTISRKGKAQVTCKQAPASSSSSGTASAAAASASDTPAPQPAAVDLPDGFLAPPGSSSSSSPIQQQQQQQLISLQHDRPKAQPIDGSTPHPFLQQIGLQTADGRIKASMQGKFTQINEFLRLLSHSGSLDKFKGRAKSKPGAAAAAAAASLDSQDSGPEDSSSSSSSSIERPVHVLDAGCGSSHLTLGTFHYLSSVLALPVRLSGVDTNAALMARSNRTCAELGIERVAQFHAAAIRDVPALGLPPPDLLLALHACDTATDEALALGVSGRARLIMCVPCCHKDLHQQFAQQQRQQQQQQQQQQGGRSSGGGRGRGRSGDQAAVTGLFAPLLGHGILKQRQLDLLTDSLRAALLRLAGYRTDVVEFVSTEHTPRNLLIRAVRATQPLTASDTARLARGYVQLRDAWGVAPRLEALLRQDGSLSEAVLRELGG